MNVTADSTESYVVTGPARDRAEPEPYRILRRLGGGAAGDVFLAVDCGEGPGNGQAAVPAAGMDPHRHIRLRVISADAIDGDVRGEVADRALVAGALGHPHLERLHWLRVDANNNVVIASEHLSGVSVAALLDVDGRLPWSRVRPIVLQVAEALCAAHEHGIHHGDLRAANVFLVDGEDGPNGEEQVKVVDFGLEPLLAAKGHLSECTAPEQIRGWPADARTDVYALGCLTYELLTGERPFSRAAPFDRLAEQEEPDLPALSRPRSGVPADVQSVLVRALACKPERRFAGAEEILRAFQRCAVEEPEGEPEPAGLEALDWVAAPFATLRVADVQPIELPAGLSLASLASLARAGSLAARRTFAPEPTPASAGEPFRIDDTAVHLRRSDRWRARALVLRTLAALVVCGGALGYAVVRLGLVR